MVARRKTAAVTVGCVVVVLASALVGCRHWYYLDVELKERHMKRMTIPGTREPGTLVEIIDGADYLISDPKGAWTDWAAPAKTPVPAGSEYHLVSSLTVDIEAAFDVVRGASGPQRQTLVANLKAMGAKDVTVTFTDQFYWAVNLADMTQRVNDDKVLPGALPYLHRDATKLVTEIWGAKLVYRVHKEGGLNLDIQAPELEKLVKAILKVEAKVDVDLNITFSEPMAVGYRLATWQGECWEPLKAAGTVGLAGAFKAEKRP